MKPKLMLILTLTTIMVGHNLYAADQVSIGIVLVEVMSDLYAPLALGGLLATVFGLGQAVVSIPSGWIIERRGHRFAASIGILLFSSFTLLTGLAVTIWDSVIYRVGFGLGQGIWNVTVYAVVGSLFTQRRGLAVSVLSVMFATGLTWGSPATAGILLWSGTWRMPFFIFGAAGFILLVLVFTSMKSWELPTPRSVQVERQISYRGSLRNRNVALGCAVGLLFGLMVSAVLGLYPTYLRTMLAFDPISAGTIMSVQTITMACASPVVLYLSDRFGRKWLLYYTGLLSALTAYGIFHLPPRDLPLALAFSSVYGASVSGGLPLIMAFVQDSVPTSRVGAATGFVNTFLYVGGTLSGFTAGYLASTVGWDLTSYFISAVGLGIFLLSLTAQETRRNGSLISTKG